MKKSDENPAANVLPPGVTEQQLRKAVAASGYPLQCTLAARLRQRLGQLNELHWINEEWSYLDRDTAELRALDIHAGALLFEWVEPQPRIRPTLNLLIECKQSSLPFVFFLSTAKPWTSDFPLFAGLCTNQPIITTDDDPSIWRMPLLQCLGLEDHPFVAEPLFCSKTFAKGQRKGKELELTGADVFNSVVLPLVKAMQHFDKTESPPDTAVYFDCHLVLAVAVIDAPMVGFQEGDASGELMLIPWVRVLRREACDAQDSLLAERQFAIDVVHKDFFDNYFDNCVLPFTQAFAVKALEHQQVLASGRGFVAGMSRSSWSDIEPRLRPVHAMARMARRRSMLRSAARGLTGRAVSTVRRALHLSRPAK